MARGSGDRGAGEGRRERFRGREGGQPGEGKAEIKPVEPKEPVVTPPVVNPPVQTPPAPQQPVLPPDPWEVYTREFIGKHGLSEAQSASALAILKELKTRAEQTERAIADRVKAAEKVADAAERQKKLTELRQPIDRMFEELKTRLEALLTAAQRSKAKEAASK